MVRIDLAQDIRPLSEFRANAAKLIEQVRETRRPLVLTQRGRSTAVVLSVEEYERMTRPEPWPSGIATKPRTLGGARGLIHIHDDFDEPLDEMKPYTE